MQFIRFLILIIFILFSHNVKADTKIFFINIDYLMKNSNIGKTSLKKIKRPSHVVHLLAIPVAIEIAALLPPWMVVLRFCLEQKTCDCTREPQSLSKLSSWGFSYLPPSCISNDFGYRSFGLK